MSSSNAGSQLYGDEDPFPIINSDEEVSATTGAGPKKRKKRIVKGPEKERSKKAKADTHPTESMAHQERFVPQTVEETRILPMETGPSSVPPIADKGKNPLEVLPSEMFEGGPTVAVHMFGDPPTIECPILEEFAAQLNETDCVRLTSAASMASLMHQRKLREELVQARAERDQALIKKVTLEEKLQQGDLHKWCAAFWFRMLSTDRMAAAIEEVNMAATKYGAYKVAVAGLKRINQDRPIKAKCAEQLPLWESLCGALIKMGTPEEIAMFPGNTPTVLSKGPTDGEPIPEVPDEYMGIELEDAGEEASKEDVADTGHSGDSWSVHRIHCMVLSEEQSREYPLYSIISNIRRSRADIYSIETVMNLEVDLLDAMRVHNVRVNQHLISKIKELREEMRWRDFQKSKDYSDSLTFETDIHDELVALQKENTRLRENQKIIVSPWFLEKHHVLTRAQHMISTRTRRFISTMDMLKERTREIELRMEYINELRNLLLYHNIDFQSFEKPEEIADPRTRSSREEFLLRLHAQDEEILDIKDKLNQCVNLLSQHGYKWHHTSFS
ncbi:OLC1v1005599C1 [Oldenlandia corymbosa var. corymbosa]|uniref:OLC1v1005599C1 n=1 Tax=Oldenlandia corymbosa var. corymbosa TaxID=529605 RepID=A0AAV1DF30_OLDCO|nr:OLC1v1005599C1 [Oldenlandia corymbosa var. corymbosa]